MTSSDLFPIAEHQRLAEDAARRQNWKRWGPYLAERQWATVREDYSADGDAWHHFPFDHARSRAYRWGEDGLLGICDRQCRLCFALALWNGRDPILKERLFGLTGPEGNHGEDVKECYYYLDSTPTHSYLHALYKYPQAEFPYRRLRDENRRRGKREPEFELADTGVFDQNRYFDVFAEYAKAAPNDVLIRITVINRGPQTAELHLLPTFWYRNTWIWGCRHEGCTAKPRSYLRQPHVVESHHETLGEFHLAVDPKADPFTWLFTDNDTNFARLYGGQNVVPYVKDALHDYVIGGHRDAVHPRQMGTKFAPYFPFQLGPGEKKQVRLRLAAAAERPDELFGEQFERTFGLRKREADDFYEQVLSDDLTADQRQVSRQAHAGMLWTKQFYHYIVEDWLTGDANIATPPPERRSGRNATWKHLFNRDVISMPDKWEYPWYAAWDLAFHMLPFSRIDPAFAKSQLELFLREWYLHPNGQLPAYEFNLADVNPPVHAWGCWQVYLAEKAAGQADRRFLASVFYKLLLNFTWWVNRKDEQGNHLFSGGFLGLDNIGLFDRSAPLPEGGRLEQADGTAWMAAFSGTMLSMALELAKTESAAEDIASKFFEHFIHIADAMNSLGGTGLWDDEDGFYYDQLICNGRSQRLKVRSMVGLIPLFAAELLWIADLDQFPGFRKRLDWFLKYRSDLAEHIAYIDPCPAGGGEGSYLLAIPSRERLIRVLRYVLDEDEFLSPYGIRSLSKYHQEHPVEFQHRGHTMRVGYVPGESDTYMFGGNSNWRGPVWFPVNYLLIESLRRYDAFYRDTLRVECPVGSGKEMNLGEVAEELSGRLARLFLPDAAGRRPCHGDDSRYRSDPHFRDLILFYEYFHGDTGRGLGASHQTGWTGLVTECLRQVHREGCR